jgi:hypothetical protein
MIMVGSYVIFYCNQYIQNSCAYILKKFLISLSYYVEYIYYKLPYQIILINLFLIDLYINSLNITVSTCVAPWKNEAEFLEAYPFEQKQNIYWLYFI